MTDTQPHSLLATLEHQLRTDRALSLLAQSHVHRAVREDSMGFLIGRDAILADWVRQDRADITIIDDFSDMIAFDVQAGEDNWQGHRWVVREGDKIVRETLIENDGEPRSACAMHPPLGELRAGRGQYDAGFLPVLPADFPEAAKPLVTLLHQACNGRAFNLYEAPWLVKLVSTLPDATFYFERALVDDDHIALLWRVHGHHMSGQRVRLIGSSVMGFKDGRIFSDMTIIDFAAMDAQLERDLISYA